MSVHSAFLSVLICEYHCPCFSTPTPGFLCNTPCFLLGVRFSCTKTRMLQVGASAEFSNQGFIFQVSYLFFKAILFSIKKTSKNNSQRYIFKVKGVFIRMFVYNFIEFILDWKPQGLLLLCHGIPRSLWEAQENQCLFHLNKFSSIHLHWQSTPKSVFSAKESKFCLGVFETQIFFLLLLF